jgi:hypothetical protein
MEVLGILRAKWRVETASEVERYKHKVEWETKKVNEGDHKEMEYDQTDSKLGWTTKNAGTISITYHNWAIVLDNDQFDVLKSDC